ncbi:hypothetical protein ACN6LC_007060 [Streptomyces violaceoruber]|uniref:hypothetical protein n=1 Tax=Streptomyces violaceoruber TaxID=1935 RepID=UPI00403C1E74
MSYGYGGGPNWPMIRAKQRAEREADAVGREGAAWRASAGRWKAGFEALAQRVREAAGQASAEHQQEGTCRCRACWDAVITELLQEAEGHGTATGHPGAAGYTFSVDDLFGSSSSFDGLFRSSDPPKHT